MINGALLVVIAVAALLNGLHTEQLSLWRQTAFLALALAAYAHGRRLPVRGGGRILVGAGAAGALLGLWDVGEMVGSLATLGIFAVLPWLAGRFRRQQAELVAHLRREQELTAERAGARERARIAADLHDSLGHDLALIALRAGALELTPRWNESDRVAAAALRRSATEASDRLRQVVGMLREGAPPVGLVDEPVAELVRRAVEAGMRVRLEERDDRGPGHRGSGSASGRAGGPAVRDPWDDGVERAAHRVVQEALTNAARYAPGAEVAVLVERTSSVVRVEVTDTGAPASGSATSGSGVVGPGTGLAGLAERARLLGGTFSAGPRGAGFAVVAELPTRGAA